MKVVGMHVVSLRGVNFGFWSHLGCSGVLCKISGGDPPPFFLGGPPPPPTRQNFMKGTFLRSLLFAYCC